MAEKKEKPTIESNTHGVDFLKVWGIGTLIFLVVLLALALVFNFVA